MSKPAPADSDDIQRQTIADFGEQWQSFDDIDTGYYGQEVLFDDILTPFVSRDDVRGKRIADIGSGTGRIVRMLSQGEPERILAVEPSEAYEVLVRNTTDLAHRIDYFNVPGDGLPADAALDYVFSIGVVHHIPDPDPTMRAAHAALKAGGRMAVWLYGSEGNRAYLTLVLPLRKLTAKLPLPVLKALSWLLWAPLKLYVALCRVLPLPMRSYARDHLARLDNRQLVATIYDQLNPAYAMYYSEAEARDLFTRNGFVNVQTRHRHGYSWTVVGQRPDEP